MSRGPVVYSPPPGTVPQNPGDVIQSSVWNAFVEDVTLTFNTVQPIAYGGTGAASAAEALTNLGAAQRLAVSTDNAIVRFDGITGGTQNSGVLIDDSNNLSPSTNDGGRLGAPTVGWSDVFLATGGALSWDNFDVSIAHAPNELAFFGASNGYAFDAPVRPNNNDQTSLGIASRSWSDLFLASGGVINWNDGQATITQSGTTLTANALFQAGTYSASGATAGCLIVGNNGTNASNVRTSTTLTAASDHALFANPNGVVGSISTTASTTTYATTSDYRRKPVREALQGFWERIQRVRPIKFQWDNGEWSRGFIAHEFHDSGYTQSVNGDKDAVDADGAPVYQTMQASSSEAMADIFAALQDIQTRLTKIEGSK